MYNVSTTSIGGGRNYNVTEEDEEIEVENTRLIDCKKKACQILQFIMKIQDELRLTNFLSNFKELVQDIESSQPGYLNHLMSTEDSLMNKIKPGESHKDKLIEEMVIKMDKLMAKIMSEDSQIHIGKNKIFKSKLLELILYKD